MVLDVSSEACVGGVECGGYAVWMMSWWGLWVEVPGVGLEMLGELEKGSVCEGVQYVCC